MEIKDLLQLKEEIDACKTEKSELEGERKALMKRLMDEWGCKSLHQAEAKLEEMETDITNLNTEIEEGLQELEEKYEL